MRRPHLTALALLLVLGVACDDSGPGTADASADTALDVAVDTDGPPDAEPADARSDAAEDASADAGDAQARDDTRWPDIDPTACGAYAEKGPHTVGMTTLQIDGTDVEVWYPAAEGAADGESKETYDVRNWLPKDERQKIPDEKAPKWEMDAYRDVASSGDGPFPLVLFSHGFAGYRMQSTFLTVHLASWGYVVASADHPSRDLAAVLEGNLSMQDTSPQVIRSVWQELERRSSEATGRFAGLVDASRVAVTGHSAGAGSAFAVAEMWDVDALVGYAGAKMDTSSPIDTGAASYLMAGENDGIIAAGQVKSAWDAMTPAKRYLEIADAGHLAFADICLVGRERGGLLEIAERNGVDVPSIVKTLADDGCRKTDLPPERAWPMINHLTTAHLRAAFGEDDPPVDLGDAAYRCFDGLVADRDEKLE